MPDIPKESGTIETRSVSDSIAAWYRWHQSSSLAQLSSAEQYWFKVFEKARVESVAIKHLPGIAINLSLQPMQTGGGQLAPTLFDLARRCFSEESDLSLARKRFEILWRNTIIQRGNFINRLFRARMYSDAAEEFGKKVERTLVEAENYLLQPSMFLDTLTPLIRDLSNHIPLTTCIPASGLSPHQLDIDSDATEASEQKRSQDRASTKPGTASETSIEHNGPFQYKIFSTFLDEESDASKWMRSGDRVHLAELLTPDRTKIRRLARDFQRKLQTEMLRRWEFDQEDGRLDSKRLSRLLTEPGTRNIFRKEPNLESPRVCVSLLVDQSGSMRGERQRISAIAIDVAVHMFETLNIPCEVLGFTSKFKGGNPISRQWRAEASKGKPGRLNAVLHVVFKSFSEQWRLKRASLALLLRNDFGKENFDGEALHWAAMRLSRRPEKKKILMIFSDGTPFDEETTAANGRIFLESHLREVIREVEDSKISLMALGRGAEVNRFYQNVVELTDDELIGVKLFEALQAAFRGR